MIPKVSRPSPSRPADARAYLRRALMLGAGLVLLYIGMQLMPTGGGDSVVSDDAGAVAQSTSRSNGPSFGPGMAVAVLILVGGSVFAYVLRRKTSVGSSSEFLETIADMPIAQDQRLRLVRVLDEVLLLGVTSREISVLQVYDASAFKLEEHGAAPGVSPAFADMLREAAGRYRNLPRN